MTNATSNYCNVLPTGYRLGDYQIEKVLGVGGFGITYLARDIQLNHHVAIKEYFPNEVAVRENTLRVQPKSRQNAQEFTWGLDRFLHEGRTLAKFKHPNIVRVLRFFPANNTGYIVMEYECGCSLASLVKNHETATTAELKMILPPLLDGLATVHQEGYLHRDIKPENIYLRDKDNSPVLLDFGAARYEVGSRSRTITATVTPGYAPFEQYQTSSGRQGPWSDIYALGAVLYRLISGNIPVESTKRIGAILRNQPDPLSPAVTVGQGRYSETWLQGIDWALQVLEKDRPQNVAEWSKTFQEVGVTASKVFQTSDQTQQFSPQAFSERDVEDFVGLSSLSFADHKYYLNVFLRALNGKTWGWSWAGLIFGPLWVAYRKMYLKSFFLCLLVLVEPRFFGLIVELGCAIYGNYWYYLHFRRLLQSAPATERSPYFAKTGGTSWIAPIVLILVMIGVVLLIGILVYWAKRYSVS